MSVHVRSIRDNIVFGRTRRAHQELPLPSSRARINVLELPEGYDTRSVQQLVGWSSGNAFAIKSLRLMYLLRRRQLHALHLRAATYHPAKYQAHIAKTVDGFTHWHPELYGRIKHGSQSFLQWRLFGSRASMKQ